MGWFEENAPGVKGRASGTPQKPAQGKAPSLASQFGVAAQALSPGIMDITRGAVKALPLAAGIGGEGLGAAGAGLLGLPSGPGAAGTAYAGKVAGGAAGGYGGKVAENAIAMSPAGEFLGMDQPQSLTEGAGKEAALMGLGTGVGVPLGDIASKVGGTLSGKALKQLAAKAEDAVRASPHKFDPVALLKPLGALKARAANMGAEEAAAVDEMGKNFLKNKEGLISALKLHEIRRDLGLAASKAFGRQGAAGAGMPPIEGLQAEFNKTISNAAREMLTQRNNLGQELIPGYGAILRKEAGEIAARNLVPRGTTGPLHPSALNPLGVPELINRAAFAKPVVQGVGNFLSNPNVLEFLHRFPQFGAQVLAQ
jgi:hypothetical protein